MKRFRLTHAIILILPFFFFHWMLPFIGSQSLGNDYQEISTQQQMELAFAIKTGSFPLFVPGFLGGQTSSVLTQGQIYHPISHIARHMPGYWDGKALHWNTLYRLLSLAAAHLCLFIFLKRLKFDDASALFLSIMAVYNLRMLDLFRYGASLEAWTGYLFLCSAIGLYRISPTKRMGPLTIVGSTYLLICGGHPQMMYYGLMGAGIFTIVAPYFVCAFLPERSADLGSAGKFWVCVGICWVVGLVLSSAYWMPFYFEFVAENSSRAGQTYAWANDFLDTFAGTINNFVNPLRSDVHGAFGGTSLFLAAACVPVLRLSGVRLPRFVWGLWTLALIAFIHMQGDRSPVHYLFWKYVPLASSFRVPGRIAMIIPLLLMMLLAWVMRPGNDGSKQNGFASSVTILAAVTLLGTVILTGLSILGLAEVSPFAAMKIRHIPPWAEWTVLAFGAFSLLGLAVFGFAERFRKPTRVILCGLVFLQTAICLRYGTWIEGNSPVPSFNQVLKQKQMKMAYENEPGSGVENAVISKHVKYTFMEPFLAKFYWKYRKAANNDDAYSMIVAGRSPDEAIVEAGLPEIASSIGETENAKGRVDLIYNSYNRFIFRTLATRPGFLVLAFPFTEHWRAAVNGQVATICRANGAYQAVRVPSGENIVEFRYHSIASVTGMVISCAMFLVIGLIAGIGATKLSVRVLVPIGTAVLSIALFLSWQNGLYSGNNIGTAYSWQSPENRGPVNIAYGKPTRMSSTVVWYYPFLFGSAYAVDGDRSHNSGFITNLEKDPWWALDLKRPEEIGSVDIHFSRHGGQYNTGKLEVLILDQDGRSIHRIPFSTSAPSPFQIRLKDVKTAKTIIIKAFGTCRLSIDEVEVFTP